MKCIHYFHHLCFYFKTTYLGLWSSFILSGFGLVSHKARKTLFLSFVLGIVHPNFLFCQKNLTCRLFLSKHQLSLQYFNFGHLCITFPGKMAFLATFKTNWWTIRFLFYPFLLFTILLFNLFLTPFPSLRRSSISIYILLIISIIPTWSIQISLPWNISFSILIPSRFWRETPTVWAKFLIKLLSEIIC